ncbi:MAG: FixH family protein [Chitinophagaceae bacterium]|nr:FixH family protein [Chitinophagaceae bacterium]
MNRIFSCAVLCALIFAACKKDNPYPAEATGGKKIAEISQNNVTATLWADDPTLQTGYNRLYVSLKDMRDNEISNLPVSFFPLMDMGDMKHSSPVEQPLCNPQTKKYEGAVVFTMPGSGMSAWQLDVSVDGDIFTFPLAVNARTLQQSGVYVGTDAQKYIIALVPPRKWQMGLNDLDLFICRQTSMMEFPADDGFTVELTPEMPSMEHGSPNNVNPVSVGKGHYKGKINYTMTGDWRLQLKLIKNGAVIVDGAYMDVLF